MTRTTTIGPIPTIIDLPRDLLHHILSWLTNDGNSVARLSLCSTSLYESIAQHSHRLWQSMYESTWEFSSSRQLSENDDYRSEYQRRYQSDLQVKSNLREMVRDLQSVLHLPTEEEDSSSPGNTTFLDRSGYIGQAWEHALWKPLLILGQEAMDVLRHAALQHKPMTSCDPRTYAQESDTPSIAGTTSSYIHIHSAAGEHPLRSESSNDNSTLESKLYSFLAARCFQSIYLAQCLYEYPNLRDRADEVQNPTTYQGVTVAMNDDLYNLEQFAILVCKVQQTPLEALHQPHLSRDVNERLDDLAETCRQRLEQTKPIISHLDNNESRILTYIRVVNQVLFHEVGFQGNEQDYYHYQNSLLNKTLETKKGIPMTLCILYACICRRLPKYFQTAYLVGLPGHVILAIGVFNETVAASKGENIEPCIYYVDAFHQGKILGIADCQQICRQVGFGWDESMLSPALSSEVLHRILNNLTNSHFQQQQGLDRFPVPARTLIDFHQDLWFQQRSLLLLHRQPSAITRPLLERIALELPLTLSPDLLRHYGLLSSSSSSSSSSLP